MPDWEFILWDKNCLKDLNSDWVNEAYSTKNMLSRLIIYAFML